VDTDEWLVSRRFKTGKGHYNLDASLDDALLER
jgi:hypothetical protein